MVSIERHQDIRSFHLLMGIYNSGFPAAESREFLSRARDKAAEPFEIIAEFTINTATWEITPCGPKAKSP